MIREISSYLPLLNSGRLSWISPSLNTVGKVSLVAFACLGAIVFITGNFCPRRQISRAASTVRQSTPVPPPSVPPTPSGSPSPASPVVSESPAFPLYVSLRCTDKDMAQIHEIIQTTGENCMTWRGGPTLLAKWPIFNGYQRAMESPKENPLHPFKFLETIFGNPSLKQHMPTIFESSLAQKGFMKGVAKGMEREKKADNLDRHIEPFSQALAISAKDVSPLIQGSSWEKLVKLLIEKLCGPPQ